MRHLLCVATIPTRTTHVRDSVVVMTTGKQSGSPALPREPAAQPATRGSGESLWPTGRKSVRGNRHGQNVRRVMFGKHLLRIAGATPARATMRHLASTLLVAVCAAVVIATAAVLAIPFACYGVWCGVRRRRAWARGDTAPRAARPSPPWEWCRMVYEPDPIFGLPALLLCPRRGRKVAIILKPARAFSVWARHVN